MLKEDSCFQSVSWEKCPNHFYLMNKHAFLIVLHSYPSVRMAWCPGRSWPKLLPWALTLSNNRFRWPVCVILHIKCLKLHFCAKHGIEAWKQMSPHISFGITESPKQYYLKHPCSGITTTSHTS